MEDGRELVEAALRLQPDVIVADISMPQLNGLDAIVQIRRAGCQARIIFLTMHCDALYAVRAIRAGASAYVLKQSAGTELLTAIRAALAGGTYLAPALADAVSRTLSSEPDHAPDEPLLPPRQRTLPQRPRLLYTNFAGRLRGMAGEFPATNQLRRSSKWFQPLSGWRLV